DGRVTPMADNLMDTSKRLQTTIARLQQVVDGDVVRVLQGTDRTLQEFSGTARSIRLLTDYLGRNPAALGFGKAGSRRQRMRLFLRQLSVAALVVSLLGLGACSSTPSRFYMLNTLAPSPEMASASQAERGPVILLGPITFPKYLDRPQIVTRASPHQL